MKRNVTYLLVLLLAACAILVTASCADLSAKRSVRIGVLLPLKGERPLAWEKVLDWVRDGINSELEGQGFTIELAYRNTFGEDIQELAKELVRDSSIQVVIGPETSREALLIAPLFEKAGKLLVSPSATSDELFRAFSRGRYFVRTCQSDVAQVRSILHVLATQGARRVSLVYEDSS